MATSRNKADAIVRHGFTLHRIFPKAKSSGVATLYARLHRLEAEAHTFAERQCNEDLGEEKIERKEKSILKRLDAILGFKAAGIPVFLNGDPRGYALKIDDAYVKANNLEIERDWGGYGIICPEF